MQSIAGPARQIVVLSISIAIGLGICRFAYSLVLPDMRDSLGWSYSAAGFMNTVNAAAYLIGALIADAFIRRVGALAAVRIGALICVLSLAMSAMSGNFAFFSSARFLSGLGAAFAMIGGAALASTLIILIGKGAWTVPLFCLAWGVRFMIHRGGEPAIGRVVFAVIALAFAAFHCATLVPGMPGPIRSGWGVFSAIPSPGR